MSMYCICGGGGVALFSFVSVTLALTSCLLSDIIGVWGMVSFLRCPFVVVVALPYRCYSILCCFYFVVVTVSRSCFCLLISRVTTFVAKRNHPAGGWFVARS
jgi:hypothetical protein